MRNFIFVLAIFSTGYMFNDIIKESRMGFLANAYAKVAGMDSSDLEDDDDFKDAVEDIIEDCEVEDDGGIDC